MKKSKIIIPAAAMLLFSTAAAVSGTVAWFSMNRTVTATGMHVKAKADSGLVITMGTALPTKSTTTTSVNFAETADSNVLYASTHIGVGQTITGSNPAATSTTGLQYVTNGNEINPETGTALNSTSSLKYADATNVAATDSVAAKNFYRDYVVYIASSGDDLTGQDVKIDMSWATMTDGHTINKAISMDFYYAPVTEVVADADHNTFIAANTTSFVGTLNCADLDAAANDGSTKKEYWVVTVGEIPAATPEGTDAIAVLMRAYYDGALIEKVTGSSVTKKCTSYKKAAQTDSGCYFYNNEKGESIVSDGQYVANTYIVDKANSTYVYARTVDIASIDDVSLTTTFTAGDTGTFSA